MQKYKDLNNNVHAIGEGFEHLLPAGSVKISGAEAIVLLTPAPETPQEASDRKDAQVEIEIGTDTVRIIMEILIPLINPSLNVTDIINQAKSTRRLEL